MKVIDLFCGCGGMSLGFQQAGFEILCAVDNWQPAIDVYQKNFTHATQKLDLSDDLTTLNNFKQIDMVIGGPPCQDFSSAGLRDETRGKADLTLKFAEVIENLQPEWFVMENVERITKSGILANVKQRFINENYGLTQVVLDASYYHVPQSRKRFFLIGKKYAQDNFLQTTLLNKPSKTPMTIYDYLGNSLGIEHYYRHPRSYQRRGIFSIHEPSPTVRGVNRPIPPNYVTHEGDTTDNLSQVRPLTTIERSYLQTFPKQFIFEGSKTNLEQMIGNAVPVNLANFVATSIKNYPKCP